MKIHLDESKSNAIAKLMGVGGAGVEALKELFQVAEAELRDVSNIDPKGNMGLQALAAQRAVEALREIGGHVFPELKTARTGKEKKEEQPRPYR